MVDFTMAVSDRRWQDREIGSMEEFWDQLSKTACQMLLSQSHWDHSKGAALCGGLSRVLLMARLYNHVLLVIACSLS